MILRAVVFALEILALSMHGARAEIGCTCRSVGSVSLAPGTSTGPLVFSTRPSTRNQTDSMFGAVNGTFACRCTDRKGPGMIAYILSAAGPRECLGVEIIREVCSELHTLGLMTCTRFWTSGAAGMASRAATNVDVLGRVARRVHSSKLGAVRVQVCNSTVSFRGFADTLISGTVVG